MSRFTRETNRRSPQSRAARVTRRKLLRAAVAAGAGAIAMPLVLPSRLFGAAAPSNRLNVAAVGTGGRCRALMTEVLRQGENLVFRTDGSTRYFGQVGGLVDLQPGMLAVVGARQLEDGSYLAVRVVVKVR